MMALSLDLVESLCSAPNTRSHDLPSDSLETLAHAAKPTFGRVRDGSYKYQDDTSN